MHIFRKHRCSDMVLPALGRARGSLPFLLPSCPRDEATAGKKGVHHPGFSSSTSNLSPACLATGRAN